MVSRTLTFLAISVIIVDGFHTTTMPRAMMSSPQPATGKSIRAPEYVINLDLEPSQRWVNISRQYKDEALTVLDTIKKRIPAHILPLLERLADPLVNLVQEPYKSEMLGIAQVMGVPASDILAMNLFYELNSGCTSIVARHANGTIFHGRNLDYGIPGLQSITVTVRFVEHGTTKFIGTTYVAYVGLLTGMRPSAFSLSVDERDTANGTVWDNAMEALFKDGHSIGWFLRDLLDNTTDFSTALQHLQTTHLDSPSYLVIGGVSDEAAVVTRARNQAVDTWKLGSGSGSGSGSGNAWFLVETNYDHWGPVPSDDDRRDAANAHMNASQPSKLGRDVLHDVMFAFPTLNSETTYSTLMSSSTQLFETAIQNL